MNPALPQPALAPAERLPQTLDWILAGLCQVMAAESGINRFIAPICLRLWGRVLRTTVRFAVLFAQWREGRLPASRPPASNPPDSRKHPGRAAAASEPKPALPRSFAWLLKFVPQADVYGTMLQYLLTDPEMVAFLAEAPQAGSLLRPLCRTLGVQPIPQMLRPQNPKPATPAPEGASPEKPPCEPPSTETPAKQAQPETAKKADPGPPPSHADDPRWARPVSLWCRPTRTKA